MTRLFQFLGLLLFSVLAVDQSTAQTQNDDLINRLGFYSSKQCILSVEQLKKEFPSVYTPPSNWKSTLDELDSKSKLIIKRLQSGDKQAIIDGEALIRTVDAIFLENPLIKGKKIAAVRRELGGKARNATGGTLGVGPSNFQNNSELPRHGWTNQLIEITLEGGKKNQRMLFTPPALLRAVQCRSTRLRD